MVGAMPSSVFQSTLAITGERAPLLQRSSAGSLKVSIHARHYWRASQRPGQRLMESWVFQSTLAITGERAALGVK